jgi:hypothetical protein
MSYKSRLNYTRWADCPPRAAVGKVQAVYGSHDHVILIFARIADFSAKDRVRKLKVMESNGKQWRVDPELMKHLCSVLGVQAGPPGGPPRGPHSGTNPQGGPSSSTRSPSTTVKSEPSSPPPFFGMAPIAADQAAPDAYIKNATTPPYSSPNSSEGPDDMSLYTQKALAEWYSIYLAHLELGKHFGANFQRLPDDLTPNVHSPYGRPQIYTSFDIGVIWALYYAAQIVLIRSHPVMPPFSLVASGFAARFTAECAMSIGQIAAGMMPQNLDYPLNPALGATLCEVMVPCFVAGVQFMKTDQRLWLVEKARRLEELTGWASIGMIGHGCEVAWERMGALGKGPPYRKLPSTHSVHQEAHDRISRPPPTPAELPDFLSKEQRQANSDQAKRVHYAMGILSEEGETTANMRRMGDTAPRPPTDE